MPGDEKWTPYALEPLRSALRRKRMAVALGAVLVLALAWYVFAESQKTKATDILANGEQGTAFVDAPERQKEKPVTVQVSPGRVVEGNPQVPENQAQVTRDPQQQYAAEAIDWGALLLLLGPWLLLGTILWILTRKRGSASDQVNFGIYKGAMPLEMITASHKHLVVTGKTARESLFGKTREDYLPREALVPRTTRAAALASVTNDR